MLFTMHHAFFECNDTTCKNNNVVWFLARCNDHLLQLESHSNIILITGGRKADFEILFHLVPDYILGIDLTARKKLSSLLISYPEILSEWNLLSNILAN